MLSHFMELFLMVLIASSKNIESSTASVSGNGKKNCFFFIYVTLCHIQSYTIINNDSLMKFNYFIYLLKYRHES